ncbi:MAG: hypothetical protein ABIA47_01715 [bacterium]
MKIKKPALAGLLQAIGVAAYVTTISAIMMMLGNSVIDPSEMIMGVIILMLLVFSAAITGALVFGYPVYLAHNKKIKEALQTFGYTLFYMALIVLLITITITV